MKNCIAIIYSVLMAAVLNAQIKTDSVQSLSVGEIRTVQSAVLNEQRVLNICLPQKYDKEKSYPVIYLLDGSIHEDFLHITGLVQFFNLMFNMPEFIIVGIANVDRKRDFTFHTDLKDLKKNYPTTGHSELFIKFIETELQPYIQSVYKTTNTKYLIGQSLGGLLASEMLLKKPYLFSHYLIVSPSLWWNDESLLKQAPELVKQHTDTSRFVYISVGKKEEKIMQDDARKLADILNQSGKKKLKVDYWPMAEENHATILHRSIYDALLKLFPYKE